MNRRAFFAGLLAPLLVRALPERLAVVEPETDVSPGSTYKLPFKPVGEFSGKFAGGSVSLTEVLAHPRPFNRAAVNEQMLQATRDMRKYADRAIREGRL